MAPKYKLWYFNGTGLGEPVRYILSYGNLEFEDSRIEMDEWPKLKPTMPLGTMPVLEVNGEKLYQSNALCRYLAKEIGGLTGKTNLEAAQADIAVDTMGDLRTIYSGLWTEPTEEAKAKKLEEIKTTHNPFFLGKLEELAKKNGGHFVNNQLTWADIYFAGIADYLGKMLKGPLLAKYPTLAALKEKVDTIPGIKAYREKRPQTEW